MTRAGADPIRIVPVIMSGGSGTRLWPMSTDEIPKQFHALAGQTTMIQDTVLRFASGPDLAFEAPVIICNERHFALASEQMAQIGVTPSAIVLEPLGRNTAAVAAVAARVALERHPGALVLLAPADHVIAAPGAFRAAIARGAGIADRIITFGVDPTGPETGYGYIQQGAPIADGVFEVARFVEKPDRALARAYLEQGGYAWNAGIFLFDPALMLAELAAHRGDVLAAVDAALAEREAMEGAAAPAFRLPPALFARTPSVAIDVAVMEPTRLAAVAPFDAGWADLGAWNEIWRLASRDGQDTATLGQALALETSGCLVWGEGRLVATLGLSDLIVVATDEAVMVLPRDRAQEVKRLVEAARAHRAAGGGNTK